MSGIHPENLEPESSDGSVAADVLVQEEPDEEEEEDEGDDKEDDGDDDGCSSERVSCALVRR